MEVGDRQIIYLSLLHCHHQNDSCINMDCDKSHFNVSLIARDKVTQKDSVHIPQFLKKKDSRSELLSRVPAP